MKLTNINKVYNDKTIFKDFNFECQNNDFVVIVGKSGVGKTTLLNIIADLTDYKGNVEKQGKISYMLQEDILLENLNIMDNLKLATNKGENDIKSISKNLQIESHLLSKPSQLSGGIARRVSLARALLKESDILLLDEPTKSLDEETKNICIETIKKELIQKPRLTICVTHNLADFEKLATKILELNDMC